MGYESGTVMEQTMAFSEQTRTNGKLSKASVLFQYSKVGCRENIPCIFILFQNYPSNYLSEILETGLFS